MLNHFVLFSRKMKLGDIHFPRKLLQKGDHFRSQLYLQINLKIEGEVDQDPI